MFQNHRCIRMCRRLLGIGIPWACNTILCPVKYLCRQHCHLWFHLGMMHCIWRLWMKNLWFPGMVYSWLLWDRCHSYRIVRRVRQHIFLVRNPKSVPPGISYPYSTFRRNNMCPCRRTVSHWYSNSSWRMPDRRHSRPSHSAPTLSKAIRRLDSA